jgi:hypothetical protein
MKKLLFFFFLCGYSITMKASDEHDLLEMTVDKTKLKAFLLFRQKWVPYPNYADRSAWDKLTIGFKHALIQKGEEALKYEWKVVKATDYIEYEKSGSRKIMEVPYNANNASLYNLVLAELAEGKGRFINQIINGVWFDCEMTSWAESAHLSSFQTSKHSLPSLDENVIDLGAGSLASLLSWTYYFLKDEMDKVNPIISKRLRKNLQERIMDTYMTRSDLWWQGFNYKPGNIINNWNPWCNFNVLSCFLLLENDSNKLADAVYRTIVSVDKFINYTKEDGACEEGPSYWGHAAGKMYDYLQLLSYATSGHVSIFEKPIIKNMGEYIVESYVGNGWVVNFADASAKGGGDKGLIFRYGKAVNSTEMKQFAAYLNQQDKESTNMNISGDFFRTMENFISYNELENTKPSVSHRAFTWYPQTEFCYMRNNAGFFLAAKGGYNAESHNHNDVGSFSLYFNEMPVFIDVGVGTYTRQTFSSERYSIWTMQSNYHNLPMANGMPEVFGREYRSKDTKFDTSKSMFSLDISGAFSKDAAIKKWLRSYTLQSNGGIIIEDDFNLSEIKSPNQVNFMTWSKPDISTEGTILLKVKDKNLTLIYDPSQFEPKVEDIPLTDEKLSKVWGKEVYRLSLLAKKKQLSGKYIFTINSS